MTKNTGFKRSELVLYTFYILLELEEITIKELIFKTGVSRATAYRLIDDIDLFISDFELWELELFKTEKKITLKRRK